MVWNTDSYIKTLSRSFLQASKLYRSDRVRCLNASNVFTKTQFGKSLNMGPDR